jgi:hypothetical protein
MTVTDDRTTPGTVTPAPQDFPKIISVDDHILEPRELWQRELPASMRDRGPKVVRDRLKLHFSGGHYGFERGVPDGRWCDLWLYDDLVYPTGLLHASAGVPPAEVRNLPAVYEDFRPGTYDRDARLLDMDTNHVEAAINFPNTFPRFCGQGFSERPDKEVALACIQIYNDWMIDEWAGGSGRGRLIPLTLIHCGTRPWPPPRCAAARPRARTRCRSRRTRASWASPRSTPAPGTCCSRPAR